MTCKILYLKITFLAELNDVMWNSITNKNMKTTELSTKIQQGAFRFLFFLIKFLIFCAFYMICLKMLVNVAS